MTDITIQELENFLCKIHPFWEKKTVHEKAGEYLSGLEEELLPVLQDFIRNEKRTNYTYGEFNIYAIQALRGNCSYFDAIMLMDAYMKDASNGKALILRR